MSWREIEELLTGLRLLKESDRSNERVEKRDVLSEVSLSLVFPCVKLVERENDKLLPALKLSLESIEIWCWY